MGRSCTLGGELKSKFGSFPSVEGPGKAMITRSTVGFTMLGGVITAASWGASGAWGAPAAAVTPEASAAGAGACGCWGAADDPEEVAVVVVDVLVPLPQAASTPTTNVTAASTATHLYSVFPTMLPPSFADLCHVGVRLPHGRCRSGNAQAASIVLLAPCFCLYGYVMTCIQFTRKRPALPGPSQLREKRWFPQWPRWLSPPEATQEPPRIRPAGRGSHGLRRIRVAR